MLEYFDIKLKKAIELEDGGHFLHALQIYKTLHLEDPKNKILIAKLAGIYDKLGNIDASVKLLDLYIAEDPDDDLVLYFSEFLIRHELYDKAVDILSLVSGEHKSIANYMLALSYFNLEEYEIAKINLETFIDENKGSNLIPDAYIYLGRAFIGLAQFDAALATLKKAEKIFSLNWELHLVIAQIYYFKEMYFHAYDEIKKAIKLESNSEIFSWAGKILIKMGEFENAEKYLRNSLHPENPDAEIFSLLGITYLNINEVQKAKDYFNKALTLNPQDKLAIDGINMCGD